MMKKYSISLVLLVTVAGLQSAAPAAVDSDAQYAQRFAHNRYLNFERGQLMLYRYEQPREPLDDTRAAILGGIFLCCGGFAFEDPVPRALCFTAGMAAFAAGVYCAMTKQPKPKPEPRKIASLRFDSHGVYDCDHGKYLFSWAQYQSVDIADHWETESETEVVQTHEPHHRYDPYRPYDPLRPNERINQKTTTRNRQVFHGQVATFRGKYGERLWAVNERVYWLTISLSDLIDIVQYYKGRYGN
jgi:hypothetical protein